jgi:hypothetical protein
MNQRRTTKGACVTTKGEREVERVMGELLAKRTPGFTWRPVRAEEAKAARARGEVVVSLRELWYGKER